jgi:hypothetical protein
MNGIARFTQLDSKFLVKELPLLMPDSSRALEYAGSGAYSTMRGAVLHTFYFGMCPDLPDYPYAGD